MSDDDYGFSDDGISDAELDESFGEPKPVRYRPTTRLFHSVNWDSALSQVRN